MAAADRSGGCATNGIDVEKSDVKANGAAAGAAGLDWTLGLPASGWLAVTVPAGVAVGAVIKFAAPDGDEWLAYLPPGFEVGQTFNVFMQGDKAVQPFTVPVPEGSQPGGSVVYQLGTQNFSAVIPEGVQPGQAFIAWQKLIPVALHEELSEEDVKPWLDAASEFEMNEDFALTLTDEDMETPMDFLQLMNRMKEASEGKVTIQALADKLLLCDFVDNIGVRQMPALLRIDDPETASAKVADFMQHDAVKAADGGALFVKPSHLSNATGTKRLGGPTGFQPSSADEKKEALETLQNHVSKFMAEKARDDESLALQSLRPGFLVQPAYESAISYGCPLEMRVITVWGKARMGIWWWGDAGQGQQATHSHRNAWFVRRPAAAGELSSSDSWETIHEHPGGNPAWEAAVALFQAQMQEMAVAAERVAAAFGAPFLRVDFFVGSTKWGLRMNEVAYGSVLQHRRRSRREPRPGIAGGCRLADDGYAIVKLLKDGMRLCQKRSSAETFLRRVGASGASYEDLRVVQPPDGANREPLWPAMSDCSSGMEAFCEAASKVSGKDTGTPRSRDTAAAASSAAKPAGNRVSSSPARCGSVGDGKSAPARDPASEDVHATFHNALKEPVELLWKGSDGTCAVVGRLGPGGEAVVDTLHAHTFVIKNLRGGVVKTWQADARKGQHQRIIADVCIDATFRNSLAVALQLFWVSPADHSLHLQANLPADHRTKRAIKTFHGHRFVAKDASGSVVWSWTADMAEGDSQDVVLRR
eukprot:TRINITY_DN36285_c0_g2_i1.p1 TRINITY_DN36285_c0_g2~~TRINITY_DN36285_c0_g2_i1.p1  ORF type:complete len:759 (+),score=128.85 TRINITY_DN36285_c0_g2_i1:97-2373(+)